MTLALYLFIPILIYSAVTDTVSWMSEYNQFLYSLFFLGLLVFVILTLRFSRRKKGFHMTPMDFLIVFMAMVVPTISGTYLQYENIGLIVAMTIMMFFSHEVLIGELRDKLSRQSLMTGLVLLVITLRGIFG